MHEYNIIGFPRCLIEAFFSFSSRQPQHIASLFLPEEYGIYNTLTPLIIDIDMLGNI